MIGDDLPKVLYEACQYTLVIALPRTAGESAVHATYRVNALVEMRRFEEAVQEARAARLSHGDVGDLVAAEARALFFTDMPRAKLLPLNRKATQLGSQFGILNQVWVALDNNDPGEAKARLQDLEKLQLTSAARTYEYCYQLLLAGSLRERAKVERLLHVFDEKSNLDWSLHRWIWLHLSAAKTSTLIGDLANARRYLLAAKAAAAVAPFALFHLTIKAIENDLTDLRKAASKSTPLVMLADQPSETAAVADGLRRKPVLGHLYRSLARAGAAGITREQLVKEVWGVTYDPRRHDERFYKALNRLRASLENENDSEAVVVVGDRYFIEAGHP